MKKYFWHGVLGVAAVIIIGWVIHEKFMVTEEERIRRVLGNLEESLEGHSIGKFSDQLHPQYRDEWGFTFQEIKGLAFQGMRMYPIIEIDPLEVEITIGEERSEIVFYPATRIENDSGKVFDLDKKALRGSKLKLVLEKKDGEWLVIRAQRHKEAAE